MGCIQSIRIFPEPTAEEPNYKVNIKAITWMKETNILFDYESDYVTKNLFNLKQSGVLLRSGNEIMYKNKNDAVDQERFHTGNASPEYLFYMNLEDGYFSHELENPTRDSIDILKKHIDSKPWFVAKSINSDKGIKGYRLTIGDLIRFGKIKFKVSRLQSSSLKNSDPNIYMKSSCNQKNGININPNLNPQQSHINLTTFNDNNIRLDSKLLKKMNDENLSCRICLGDSCENEFENPIIQPCKCTGTMKYVHLECFKSWMKKQIIVKSSTNLISYYWKKLQCELCKDIIDQEIMISGHKYSIIDLPIIEQANLVLESYMNDKSKGFHIIKFSEIQPSIRLGRGTSCDIRINDISVSRQHAIIKLEKGKFYLQDNNSKFGTLILIQEKNLLLSKYKEFSIQIGKTILEIKATKISRMLFKSTKKTKKKPEPKILPLDVLEPQLINLNKSVLDDNSLKPMKQFSSIDVNCNDFDSVRRNRDDNIEVNQIGNDNANHPHQAHNLHNSQNLPNLQNNPSMKSLSISRNDELMSPSRSDSQPNGLQIINLEDGNGANEQNEKVLG